MQDTAPKKPKKSVNLSIDAELAAEAMEAGTNKSALLEKALRAELKAHREAKWREETARRSESESESRSPPRNNGGRASDVAGGIEAIAASILADLVRAFAETEQKPTMARRTNRGMPRRGDRPPGAGTDVPLPPVAEPLPAAGTTLSNTPKPEHHTAACGARRPASPPDHTCAGITVG